MRMKQHSILSAYNITPFSSFVFVSPHTERGEFCFLCHKESCQTSLLQMRGLYQQHSRLMNYFSSSRHFYSSNCSLVARIRVSNYFPNFSALVISAIFISSDSYPYAVSGMFREHCFSCWNFVVCQSISV